VVTIVIENFILGLLYRTRYSFVNAYKIEN